MYPTAITNHQLTEVEVLPQEVNNQERVLAYASHPWSRADERKPLIDEECMTVMWSVSKFQPYTWEHQFTLIQDYSALALLSNN